MVSGGFFQKKAAATPEEKLRSFIEKYERSGRVKKFFIRKVNPVFYALHAKGRVIVPIQKTEEVSGSELCAMITGVLGQLSERSGFNNEGEIGKCAFRLNVVQFKAVLAGARDIVRSQYSMNGRMPYEIELVCSDGRHELAVRLAPLLAPETTKSLRELFVLAGMAHFQFGICRGAHGESFEITFPASKTRQA